MGPTVGQTIEMDGVPASMARHPAGERRYLYGPVIDFLCLGGASILLLPVVLALPENDLSAAFGAAMLFAANFINHPHFAVSYQIFYGGFRRKAFGAGEAALRARYVFAGIVVPLTLALFFVATLIQGDAKLLGYGANAMAFLVGWHYVKQGYGMLMVDAALKRQFFSGADRKTLLVNAYAIWALAWLAINAMVSQRAMWGIQYYAVDVPRPVLAAGLLVALATTVMAVVVLMKKWRAEGGSLPWNGVVAYGVSLYLWLLLMHWNVLWLFTVPALHSIQYLVVVSRYSANRFKDGADANQPPRATLLRRIFRRRHQLRLAGFLGLAVILGYAGFYGVPKLLPAIIPYDEAVFGATAYLFVFWVFINVHHYFLDNVMWRSQNPDMRRYLFA